MRYPNIRAGQGSFVSIVPPEVACVEKPAGLPGAVEALHPLEVPIIQNFASRRAAEFAEGRACVREALRLFSQCTVTPQGRALSEAPILRAENRAPVWPEGIVGSITHCEGIRAAAIADATRLEGLGIDAEPVQELSRAVASEVLLSEELAEARSEEFLPRVEAETTMFSAKESLFKVWSPATGRWLGFEEARVRIEPDGRLDITVLADHPDKFSRIQGRWLTDGNLTRTAVWIATQR